MAVLGRTLEHLGVQMYKRRDTAIAELVANCWDADATRVWVSIPDDGYDPATSVFVIEDDGNGMSSDDVEGQYLVVGRNRRSNGADGSRKVMGRKGIGKLAGFGIATKIQLTTWRDGSATQLTLDIAKLKLGDNDMRQIEIPGQLVPVPNDVKNAEHGTRIVLTDLKHSSPPDVDRLREALARRFSRTVRGSMAIEVNDVALAEPTVDWEYRMPDPSADAVATFPDGDTLAESGEELQHDIGGGKIVRYRYGFSKTVLQSAEMRGFTILTNGKTAQAPPYFFAVEATASGQHGTKYLLGTIEADFLDAGADDESDLVSTDRQEIDWEAPETKDLLDWGADLTRRALREFRDRRAEKTKQKVLEDDDLRKRVERLDPASKKRAMSLMGSIGLLDTDDGKELELASSLISAFEYQQFHDVVDQIEAASNDPDQLMLLLASINSWKALEGRAILEVIKGRISIIEKFYAMIVNDAPETAHVTGDENMHDLVADFPWLLDPEWQVLAEEKSISKQLREWAEHDLADQLTDEHGRQRYDFMALGDQGRLVVIEIKRAAYAPTVDDIHRLLQYKANLNKAEDRTVICVFISSEEFADKVDQYRKMDELQLLGWNKVHKRTKAYYEHYRAVLEGDVDAPDFGSKSAEVARTREVLDNGAYRGRERRATGLGPQDAIRERLDDPGQG